VARVMRLFDKGGFGGGAGAGAVSDVTPDQARRGGMFVER